MDKNISTYILDLLIARFKKWVQPVIENFESAAWFPDVPYCTIVQILNLNGRLKILTLFKKKFEPSYLRTEWNLLKKKPVNFSKKCFSFHPILMSRKKCKPITYTMQLLVGICYVGFFFVTIRIMRKLPQQSIMLFFTESQLVLIKHFWHEFV